MQVITVITAPVLYWNNNLGPGPPYSLSVKMALIIYEIRVCFTSRQTKIGSFIQLMDTDLKELKHMVFIWLKSQTCLVFLFCQIEKFKEKDLNIFLCSYCCHMVLVTKPPFSVFQFLFHLAHIHGALAHRMLAGWRYVVEEKLPSQVTGWLTHH